MYALGQMALRFKTFNQTSKRTFPLSMPDTQIQIRYTAHNTICDTQLSSVIAVSISICILWSICIEERPIISGCVDNFPRLLDYPTTSGTLLYLKFVQPVPYTGTIVSQSTQSSVDGKQKPTYLKNRSIRCLFFSFCF